MHWFSSRHQLFFVLENQFLGLKQCYELLLDDRIVDLGKRFAPEINADEINIKLQIIDLVR